MNLRSHLAAVFLLGAGLASASAQPSPVVSAPLAPRAAAAPAAAVAVAANYESFRYIGDDNIFNPYRVGRRAGEASAPPVETITLVGTMSSEKGLYAFFDSPESAYRKALHEGDTIAQYTVKKIAANEVDLLRDAKPVSLVLGQQLRRPPGGDWSVGFAPRVETAPAGSAAMPVIPADASDILKRLMEQRQKQLKQ